jgi:hypothetical protein
MIFFSHVLFLKTDFFISINKNMNYLKDDIVFMIDEFLTNKESIYLTSLNKHFRICYKIRYKTLLRALIQKQYQEGIRDGFTLLLDNINPRELPVNNINGFFMDDPLSITDPWYNSALTMNRILDKIIIISSRYN